MKSSLMEKSDNPDITAERLKATFKVDEMANFIHGGAEIVKRRAEILEFVESRPEFETNIPLEFLSREERYEAQAKKAVAMTDLATEAIDGSDFFGEGMYYQGLIMGRDLHAMSLHYVMFIPTLQGQATDDQMEKWLGMAISRSILGTYAQTELGHGTNLSRLETTATYDPKTEQFVIHSPTISSAKWWPGALGKSSNFAVVMAQLITADGVCHGPHPFIVQLRHLDTHQPFDTIEVGDIGPKLGINGSDNGFLIFKHHRIPRNNMLMRHAQVTKEGAYIKPKHDKLGYGSMIFVRSIMIRDQSMQLGAAVTIATRYSAVRRQGELDASGKEVQILDYQTQQYRILPHIAATIIFLFAASEVRNLYLQVTEQLLTGNVELLARLHALSSGLKSVVSWEVAKGIEQCRLACGGHGYSQASGFPEIYGYAVGGCTYEGENIVMLLQVARHLMKVAKQTRQNPMTISEDIDHYITIADGPPSGRWIRDKSVTEISPAAIVRCFEDAARTQIFHALDLLTANEKRYGKDGWNRTSVELCRASRLHVKAYLVRNYFGQVSACESPSVKEVLTDLGRLFSFNEISSIGASFKSTLNDPNELTTLRAGIYELLTKLRPNMVAIVDSLDFSDRELNSVLGRRDGNVYTALLEWAKKSPLNKTEVSTAYHKYLRPMMLEGRAKL